MLELLKHESLLQVQVEQVHVEDVITFDSNILESLYHFWLNEEGVETKIFKGLIKVLRIFQLGRITAVNYNVFTFCSRALQLNHPELSSLFGLLLRGQNQI